MAKALSVTCARPTGGPVGEAPAQEQPGDNQQREKEEKSMISIGRKVPDFTAPAYYKGDFVNIKLSEYLGKWVLLCFYPGDFTFV